MPNALQRSIGIVASIVTAPVIAALAIAVRLDSRGPVIYAARRTGRDGAVFRCFKLRTMRWAAEESGPAVSVADDRRITRVGRWLRRHRLDELPQLWNVARGEMVLVGPRPEDPRFIDPDDPLHREVCAVLPGITGLTQLAFADEATLIDAVDPDRHYRQTILPLKLALDRDYLRRRSLGLDLWILVQTLLTAVGHRTPLESIEARR